MEHDVTELKSQIISSPKRSKSVLKDDFRCYEIIPTKESSYTDPPYKVFDLWPNGENSLHTVNLILLGETGKGKTTLIDGILNHLLCVKLYHAYRWLAPVYYETPNKCDSDSQTEQVTVYNLPYLDGMPYTCNFKLIDTPGMLDTHGSEVQSKNIEKIKLFLKNFQNKEILHIGIVTEAHLNHGNKVNALVKELKDIMHELPKVKVISIATFADESKPECYSVLEKNNITLDKKIKIDNSAIFINPLSCNESLGDQWESWENKITSLLDYLYESNCTNGLEANSSTSSSIQSSDSFKSSKFSSICSSRDTKHSRLSSMSFRKSAFITAKTTFSMEELKPNLIHTKGQCDNLFKKIDGYDIMKELAAGAYGVLKKAYNKDTKQMCVLKLIINSKENSKGGMDAEDEVKVLSSLRHPYVVQYLDHFVDSGQLFIAMELCGGGTLRQLIKEQKKTKIEEREILDMFCQMCLGLKYIHGKNILHRDLKPDNVFITDDQRLKLGDFGHAKNLDHTLSLANTFCGTKLYMSPEIHNNCYYNDKNDIWALGCMLYEMAALESAFNKVLDIQTCTYKPLVRSSYSPELEHLVRELLQKDPNSRPSASAILIKPLMLARLSKFITGCNEDILSKLIDERNKVSGYECDLNELKSTLEEEKKKIPVFKCELNELRRALKEEKMKVQDEKKKVNKHQSALEEEKMKVQDEKKKVNKHQNALEEEKENVQDERKKVEELQRALKDEKKIVQNTDQQMAVPEVETYRSYKTLLFFILFLCAAFMFVNKSILEPGLIILTILAYISFSNESKYKEEEIQEQCIEPDNGSNIEYTDLPTEFNETQESDHEKNNELNKLQRALEEEKKNVQDEKKKVNEHESALEEEKKKVQYEKKKVNKHENALEEEKKKVQVEKKKVEELQRALKNEKKIVQNTDQQMAVLKASGLSGPSGGMKGTKGQQTIRPKSPNTDKQDMKTEHQSKVYDPNQLCYSKIENIIQSHESGFQCKIMHCKCVVMNIDGPFCVCKHGYDSHKPKDATKMIKDIKRVIKLNHAKTPIGILNKTVEGKSYNYKCCIQYVTKYYDKSLLDQKYHTVKKSIFKKLVNDTGDKTSHVKSETSVNPSDSPIKATISTSISPQLYNNTDSEVRKAQIPSSENSKSSRHLGRADYLDFYKVKKSLSTDQKSRGRSSSSSSDGDDGNKSKASGLPGQSSGTEDSKVESSDDKDFAKAVLIETNAKRKIHCVDKLTLNEEICKYAKEWAMMMAKDNQMFHRPDGKYGMNVFCVSSNSKEFEVEAKTVVDSWYSQSKDHAFVKEPEVRTLKTACFTQLIWKDCKQMGVGKARSVSGLKVFVVANFDPAGLLMGEFVKQVPPVGGFPKESK